MPRVLFVAALLAVLAVVVSISPATGSDGIAHAANAIPGQYIVALNQGVDPDKKAEDASRDQKVTVENVYRTALNGFSFRGSEAAAKALAKQPGVAFVSEDGAVEAYDRTPSRSGNVTAQAQSVPTGVNRIGAPRTNTGSGVAVAVIDTGIDLTHPDLSGVVAGKTCIRGTRTPNDDNGHGTHVAGSIAARNNDVGVVGVAPGATLIAVKVLDSRGSGSWSDVICGIDWVAANAAAKNIKVASMSLGGSGSVPAGSTCATTTDSMRKAICNATAKGVTFVVAAGNSGTNLATFTPAAYPEVLTVTAITDSDGIPGGLGGSPSCRISESDDAPASFSNYASANDAVAKGHTVAAPGVCITSTWKGGAYNTISGTSMATPHVSGLVALCIASGTCTGAPSNVIATVMAGAQAKDTATPTYGFTGDPTSSPSVSRSYGYLVWAGGY